MSRNNSVIDPVPSADEQKRQRVLERAVDVFLNYGFQRTTMDDIARAAEMSRPALYLLFRNKSDIYRAIADKFFQIAFEAARAALAGEGSLEARLERMLDDAIYATLARIHCTPHGAEILDAKTKLAGDVATLWHGRMTDIVEEAILRAVEEEKVDLALRGYSARGLAELFWDAVEGAKTRIDTLEAQRAATRAIARLVADAVSRR